MNPELPPGEPPADKPKVPSAEKSIEKPIAAHPASTAESPVPTIGSPPARQMDPDPKNLPNVVLSPTEPAPPIPPPTATPTATKLSTPPDSAEQEIRRVSRRSFAVAGGAAAAGFAGWFWLRTRSPDAGIPWPLRRVIDFNAKIAQEYFKDSRLARNYAAESAGEPRVNGRYGFEGEVDLAHWKLRVETPGHPGAQQFNMHDIRSLPRVEMTTELTCIEGWAQVVQWAGARFADFVAAHGLGLRDGKSMVDYVSIDCVGGGYYVGLDIASAMHPQTLLCYEMNGAPLTSGHGAPLRLVIPVKYGIKNIKRIGTIRFLDTRPPDYWAELGYDWYAGL